MGFLVRLVQRTNMATVLAAQLAGMAGYILGIRSMSKQVNRQKVNSEALKCKLWDEGEIEEDSRDWRLEQDSQKYYD